MLWTCSSGPTRGHQPPGTRLPGIRRRRMGATTRFATALLWALACPPATLAGAQTVEGTVDDDEWSVPIETAGVVLLAAGDSVVGEYLTDERGRFVISIPDPSLSANVRETRSTQRIRVGRRQRKRTCWDCEREWKRMVVPLEPGRPSEARQLLRTRR